MLKNIKTWYQNTFQSFKINKLFQWLDEWEIIMIKYIKYDLSDLKNDHWLRDLADLIQSTSEFYYKWFMKNINDDNKSDSKKF